MVISGKGIDLQSDGGDRGESLRHSLREIAGEVEAMEKSNLAKSAANITGDRIAARAIGRSRFLKLNDLSEEEGDQDGGANVGSNEVMRANQGLRVLKAVKRWKNHVAGGGVTEMDGDEISASDPDLLKGVRNSLRLEVDRRSNPKLSISDHIKERTMTEVTNSITLQPVNLKPMWTGLKTGKGAAIREVGPAKGWVAHGEQLDLNRVSKYGPNGPNESVGPAYTRPPAKSMGMNSFKSLDPKHSDRLGRDVGGE